MKFKITDKFIYKDNAIIDSDGNVNGFEIQYTILLNDRSYLVVFQSLERNYLEAYNGYEMSTASKYGCDWDQSNEVDEIDESIINKLEKLAEIECEKWSKL